jgi:hypothetical protein
METLLVFQTDGEFGGGQIRRNEAIDCVNPLCFLRFVQQNRGDSTASEGGIMLIYRCPTTAKIVHSGIDASEADVRRLSVLKLSLWCPYCQGGHPILGKDMQVAKDIGRSAA